MFFMKFGAFLAIMPSHILSILSVLSFCDTNCMHVSMSDDVSWVSAHFYSFTLLSVPHTGNLN